MKSELLGTQNLACDLAAAIEKNLGPLLRSLSEGSPSLQGRSFSPVGGLSRLPKDLRVLGMPNEYERINATAMARKSANQLRKWRVERATSVETFANAIGSNCLVRELALEHAHILHRFWQQRALAGEVRINSANRLMRNLSGLYGTIHAHYRLEFENPFAKLNLRGGREGKRIAYRASFVRDQMLAEGALDSLNPEARRIVYLIIETGLRPSEACALDRSTINLEGSIPFVQVTDDMRQTKAPGSVRAVPLVGVALAALSTAPWN
ncbi:site-specific integrase [Hyphomicrobium sulfonivorans]|nr:site-specific integrase [Hyphomicrobium sulfonivorans]